MWLPCIRIVVFLYIGIHRRIFIGAQRISRGLKLFINKQMGQSER